jgi:ribonucleoside-diphosphate reductase alpha chain
MVTHREKLPVKRESRTTNFNVAGLKGYMIVGLYDSGRPGEVFLKVAKTGTTMQGILDGLAIMISHALQYGVPLGEITKSLKGMRFEPFGMTTDEDVPAAQSVCDYIALKLEHDYREFL